MQRKSNRIDVCGGPILKNMLKFSVPLIFSGLLQLLFNAADVVVVGKFAGEESLAAVSSTGSLINLLTNLFLGMSVGADVMVARHIGAKQEERVKKAVHTAMLLAVFCGILLTITGMLFTEGLLVLMDTDPDVLPLASLYLRIYFAGMLAGTIYNFGGAVLRASGDTKRPMYYLTFAGAVNVILNLIMVIAFDLGVVGVAVATVVSQFISAILVVRCLMREEGMIRLRLRELGFDKKELIGIIQIGLPAGLQGVIFSLSNVVIQSSINGFKKTVMAGSGAASNLEGFVYVIMNAFHQSTVSFVSQNYGAGNYARIKKIIISGLSCVIVAGLVFGNLEILFGRQLLSLYSDEEAVIEAGMQRLPIMCCVYFFCGAMEVMVAVMRGIGYSVRPMLVSLIGACGIRLIWLATIFQMEGFHTVEVVYWSYPVSWIITFLAHVVCFLLVRKKAIPEWRDMNSYE